MSLIDDLHRAADMAAAAEARFRREAAERIAVLECERAFCFRRLNLIRTVADAVGRAENEETAVASGLATLRAKLDWSSESEVLSTLLSRFAPVVQSLFASLKPGEGSPDCGFAQALAEFETWYAATHGTPFWTLFEQTMVETPRIDF